MFDWQWLNWPVYDWHLPFYKSPCPPQLLPGTHLKVERIFKQYAHASRTGFAIFQDLSLTLKAGDCIALEGESLSQKSALLQTLYGQSSIDAGEIWVTYQDRWINLAKISERQLKLLRQQSIGYLGKFLPTNPHATTLETALDPLLELGVSRPIAQEQVENLFRSLNLPTRLWRISPTALSVCEKQRVNLARILAVDYPILLLNTPTFGLDDASRRIMIDLINHRKASGCGVIGIFQDEQVKNSVCTNTFLFEDTQNRYR